MKRIIFSALLIPALIGMTSCGFITQSRSITETVTENTPTETAQETVESAPQTEQPLVVIAYLKVKPEDRQTFLDVATRTAQATNEKEPGANTYIFYEDQNTPNLFFFFEEWQDQASFEAHLEQPHTQELTEQYAEILAEPADVKIYTIQGVETIQVP